VHHLNSVQCCSVSAPLPPTQQTIRKRRVLKILKAQQEFLKHSDLGYVTHGKKCLIDTDEEARFSQCRPIEVKALWKCILKDLLKLKPKKSLLTFENLSLQFLHHLPIAKWEFWFILAYNTKFDITLRLYLKIKCLNHGRKI